jgi:hypothetical protein
MDNGALNQRSSTVTIADQSRLKHLIDYKVDAPVTTNLLSVVEVKL